MRVGRRDGRVSAGDIFDRLGEILRENALPAGGCVAALTAFNVILDEIWNDLSLSNMATATAPALLASLTAQYYLTTPRSTGKGCASRVHANGSSPSCG